MKKLSQENDLTLLKEYKGRERELLPRGSGIWSLGKSIIIFVIILAIFKGVVSTGKDLVFCTSVFLLVVAIYLYLYREYDSNSILEKELKRRKLI